MNRRFAALTIAAVALFGLTACTGSSGDSGDSPPASESSAPSDGDGQSVADACALVQDTIEDATAEFGEASVQDPAAVVDAMQAAAGKLAEAASQVTNEDVAAILPDLEEMFATTAEVMQGIVEGDISKLDDLTALGDGFQETTQRFQELCAPE
jgi:hypothetical protein